MSMSAVDKCINRLIFLEGEVSSLRTKVNESQQWRRRMKNMENWLQSRFDYDPNKAENFEGNDINLPSTSTSSSSQSASMLNGKYFSNATTTSSSSMKRKNRNKYQQVMEYPDPEESTPRVNLRSSLSSKRRRNFITDSVHIEATSVDDVEEDADEPDPWRTIAASRNAEDIKIEPCFEIQPEMEIEEEGQRNEDGLAISGDEWEIYNNYNSEEDDITEEKKFTVLGYTQCALKNEPENETDEFSSFGVEEASNFSEEAEEPSAYVSRINTTLKRNSMPSRLSILNSNVRTTKPPLSIQQLKSTSKTRSLSSTVNSNLNRPKISLASLVKANTGIQSVQHSRLQTNLSHLLQQGNNLKKPNCSYCGKPFNTPAELMRHQRIHVGDKPFSCYVCQYSTSFNGDLVRHLKSRHPGKDPYVCHLCSFKCKELLMFTDHRRRTGHGGRGAKRLQTLNSSPYVE